MLPLYIPGTDVLHQPGSMGVYSLVYQPANFLSFVRIIGCAYYTSHESAFIQRMPQSLFVSVKTADQEETPNQIHYKWLQAIHQVVWERADTESQTMPSTEALLLHWRRSMWVVHMWHQATSNEIVMPGTNQIHCSTDFKISIVK